MTALPANEAERVAALRRYDILDTPPDGAFDRITRIAARLFDVPISIVSLVDSDRIWFKSHHGLEAEEIPRGPGLCASAILDNKPCILSDASVDPASMANPLVAGEFGLRFYAGIPLRTHDGFNLGTLCVIDHEPRTASTELIAQLTDLAAVVMDEMELRLSARDAVFRLQRSVEEKEVLLREVHHRVKNNLQVIGSLIELEARNGDVQSADRFNDVLRRIESVGRLHERFYRGSTIEAIDLLGFLAALARDVVETYGMSDRVQVTVECGDLRAGLDSGTPLSLIVTELVANACKHAFPAGREGRIRLIGERQGGDYVLSVADDGVGMKAASPGSMGLRLVELMARQLDGLCRFAAGERGTVFTLRFPA